MTARSSTILFFLIFISIALLQDSDASNIMNLSFFPSETIGGITTTLYIEVLPYQNLSDIVLRLSIDGDEKAVKNILRLTKNVNQNTTFDHYFAKNDYLGEHYIEIKMNYTNEDNKTKSEVFYETINILENKKPFNTFRNIFLVFSFVIIVINVLKRFFCNNKYIIELNPDEIKTLFNLQITVLPISISLFLLLAEKEWMKFGTIFTLYSFLISFVLATYSFITAIKKNSDLASNFLISSLAFLLFGLFNLVLSIWLL